MYCTFFTIIYNTNNLRNTLDFCFLNLRYVQKILAAYYVTLKKQKKFDLPSQNDVSKPNLAVIGHAGDNFLALKRCQIVATVVVCAQLKKSMYTQNVHI